MAADPLVGKVLADRFEILDRIGEGGTGVVYKAKQTAVDRMVAIKVLGAHVSTDPNWVKRFQTEARAGAKLESQHTVRSIDYGQTKEGLLYIAMELLIGKPLSDELKACGRMDPVRALHIIAGACESLSEAHGLGIIHRDIKPDNLYLCDVKGDKDFVKVLDFSVAKVDDPNSAATRAGVVFGTPQYMSPEQGKGGAITPAVDIYALGIVLYEMLSGKPPFDSPIPTQVVLMHIKDKPTPLTNVPAPVGNLVMRMLDKEPKNRPASCDALGQEIAQIMMQLGAPARGPVRPTPMPAPMPQMQGGGHVPTGAMTAQVNVEPGVGPQAVQPGMRGAPQGMPGQGASGVDVRGMGVSPDEMARAQAQLGRGGQGGYGAPQQGYGAPQQGYGAPQQGYGAPQQGGYGAPQQGGYGAPPPAQGGYGAPQQGGYGAPQQGGYGAPQQGGYGASQQAPGREGLAKSPPAGGTMILPDSSGIVAMAVAQAQAVRANLAPEAPPAKPAGPLFWAAWAVIGVGIGLAAHFYWVHTQLAALAGGS